MVRGRRRPLSFQAMNILQAIGGTSLVRLQKVVPPGSADVLVKCEWENPTGAMKDRMALGAIRKAEEDGRLKPGYRVVEYSGGTTGASIGLVCAALGYRLHVVTSDAFSRDKLDQMAAMGAELTIIPAEGGPGVTSRKVILDMIATAREMSREPGTYWFNQLENADIIPGYYPMGEEIWEQTGGRVTAFVQAVGSACSLRGVAEVLKRHNPATRIVAVEPGESPVLSGGQHGRHRIDGIGIGYTPPLWDASVVDQIIPVPTEVAEGMARRLAREEAIFTGTSSGANVVAAIQVAQELGPGKQVVTLAVDSGLKYLNTGLYRRQ